MPMQLYFKNAKSFTHQTEDHGTKQFLAQPGPSPIPVPFWVADTATFKQGIKDGSIVNLTPPEQMPGYKPAPAAVVEEAQAATEAEIANGDEPELEVEQTKETQPQAPFGAQPMTPVQAAPKVGGITANGKGRK